jgi:hypothetical protein
LLLFASLACTVTVDVLVPLAVIEGGLALIVVLAALNGAAVKTTEAGLPIVPPAMVPVMLAVPTVAGEVKVAV